MAQPDAGETLDGALGIRTLGHVLDVGGLDLVAEFLVDKLAPDVVRLRPAAVIVRADIDEAGLQLVGGVGAACHEADDDGRARCGQEFTHRSVSLFGRTLTGRA